MEKIQKTRLGISVAMFGAALYFMGLVGMTPLIILAGYTLIMEKDVWLKKVAVRAVAIVLIFAALSATLGLLTNSTSILNNLVLLFNGSINLSQINRLVSIFQIILSTLQTICLLLLGLSALKKKDIPLGPLDKASETIGNKTEE